MPQLQLERIDCATCGEPLGTDPRHVTAIIDDLAALEAADERRRAAQAGATLASELQFHTVGDILTSESYGPTWQVMHGQCVIERELGGYWFDLDRMDTYAKALAWTLHLSQKTWWEPMSWEALIRALFDLPQA